MLKIINKDHTNGRNPLGLFWTFSTSPFPIYKVGRPGCGLLMNVTEDFSADMPVRVITSKESGNVFLAPLPEEDAANDRPVLLLAHTGLYRGDMPVVRMGGGCHGVKDLNGVFKDHPFVLGVYKYAVDGSGWVAVRIKSQFRVTWDVFFSDSEKSMTEAEFKGWLALRGELEMKPGVLEEIEKEFPKKKNPPKKKKRYPSANSNPKKEVNGNIAPPEDNVIDPEVDDEGDEAATAT